jgi:hypothetical protein
MNEHAEERVDVLRRKITALESLASNPGTTVAESESAQSAANKLRLELAKLTREAASRGPREITPSPPPSAPAPPPVAVKVKSPLPAWTWQVPGLGILGLVGVSFWMRAQESAAPAASSDSSLAAAGPAPGAVSQTREAAAAASILARIAETQGTVAAAEAVRACRMRDLVKEFQATSGGTPRAGEGDVDVRRRCGTYLSVRGFDDAACFPRTDGNAYPLCPVPE